MKKQIAFWAFLLSFLGPVTAVAAEMDQVPANAIRCAESRMKEVASSSSSSTTSRQSGDRSAEAN